MMKRRSLIKGLLGTAGAAAWLVSKPAAAAPLAGLAPKSVPILTGSERLTLASAAETYFSFNPFNNPASAFPLSVASGDPAVDGIVLWTRLPDQVGPEAIAGVEIATSRSFLRSQIIVRALGMTSAEQDWTLKLPLNNSALRPNTTYFYRFIFNNTASRVGRFRTLPRATDFVWSLRMGFISCNDYGNGFYTALKGLADDQPDFVVHLGDYIYETIGSPTFQAQAIRPIGPLPSGGTVTTSLADYRYLYRTYAADPNMQKLHETSTFIQIWDDHEFRNDSWGSNFADDTDTPGTPNPALRKAANQAWAEYVPARVTFDGTQQGVDSLRIYRSFKFGRLAELFATDERQYRDAPPCGLASANRNLTVPCPEVFRPDRTMLGVEQRDWLLNGLKSSTSTWKIWANEVMLSPLRALNSGKDETNLYVSLDAWDGYPAERSLILKEVHKAGVRNLVAITGDIHSFAAGSLFTDFNNLLSPSAGVEFVGGSVTSSNLVELAEGALPPGPSDPMDREALLDVVGIAVESVIRLGNLHLALFNSSTHGYSLLDIGPFFLTCTFKEVDTVRQPTSPVRVLKRYRVFEGLPYVFEV